MAPIESKTKIAYFTSAESRTRAGLGTLRRDHCLDFGPSSQVWLSRQALRLCFSSVINLKIRRHRVTNLDEINGCLLQLFVAVEQEALMLFDT